MQLRELLHHRVVLRQPICIQPQVVELIRRRLPQPPKLLLHRTQHINAFFRAAIASVPALARRKS